MIALSTYSVVAWMLTYALHSSILLGGAWGLDRGLRLRPAWRDTLWKAALVGALFSASTQTAMQTSPLGEAFLLDVAQARELDVPAVGQRPISALADVEISASGATGPAAPTGITETGPIATSAANSLDGGPDVFGGVAARATAAWGAVTALSGFAALVLLWAFVAAVLVARVVISQWRAARAVRARTAARDPRLLQTIEELRTAFGISRPVRLSILAGLATPVALGRSEVVLPAKALRELSPPELEAALAHELAHLARFDPIWRIASALLGAVFFMQPMNRLARRRIAEVSEALADAGAVRVTGTPIPLARCLTTVAGWMTTPQRSTLAAMVPMATDRSELAKRVERVLEDGAAAVQPSRVHTNALFGLVLLAGFLSPRIGAEAEPQVPEPLDTAARAFVDPLTDRTHAVDDTAPMAFDADSNAGSRRSVASSADTVVAHPEARRNRGTALADRFDWAVREGSRQRIGDVWVVYRFPAPAQAGSQWAHKSRWGGTSDGEELTRFLGDVEVEASDGYALVRIKPSRDGTFSVVEAAGQAAMLGDFDFLDRRVYWLGAVPAEQGVALLRRLMPDDGIEVREGLLELIGMHDDPSVVPYLLSVLNGDDDDRLRAEAAESLELYAEPAVTRALENSAMRDRAEVVRVEAAEALGELGGDEARDALIRIIDTGPEDAAYEAVESLAEIPGAETTRALANIAREAADPRVRREASEHLLEVDPRLARDILAGTSGAEAPPSLRREAIDAISDRGRRNRGEGARADVDLLAEVAFTDPNEEVRREAVEALADYGAAAEVALLRIAFDHPIERVARQAAETLGELPADVAVDALVRLTRESDSERVVVQAVESLGEFRGDRVEDILADIADSHRFRSARREARDQLYGP